LTGFREWLIVKANTGNNLVWEGLVNLIVHNEGVAEEEKIRRLGEVLAEFHALTGSTIGATTGLMRVYVRYHGWLLNQSWYKPAWPGYVPPYDRSEQNH
jgi:hypothetical protein